MVDFSLTAIGLASSSRSWISREVTSLDHFFICSFERKSIKIRAMDAESICKQVHSVLHSLPFFTNPSQVPFLDGLYFFYEEGESSSHGPEGRIVRVGNHPRSDHSLIRRLRQHYFGKKNGSVFRKFLGGALMREADQNLSCLSPGPGLGHWEQQDAKTCPTCQPVEDRVSRLLKSRFGFRCVKIINRQDRNRLEALLIATLSSCSVCRPSTNWLGLHAYSTQVRSSGLWNSQHVNGVCMCIEDVQLFRNLIEASI
jgi:hypothetical protein